MKMVAQEGRLSIAECLLHEGKANVNQANDYGATPLSIALSSEGSNSLMIALLVVYGAEIPQYQGGFPEALWLKYAPMNNPKMIKALVICCWCCFYCCCLFIPEFN